MAIGDAMFVGEPRGFGETGLAGVLACTAVGAEVDAAGAGAGAGARGAEDEEASAADEEEG